MERCYTTIKLALDECDESCPHLDECLLEYNAFLEWEHADTFGEAPEYTL